MGIRQSATRTPPRPLSAEPIGPRAPIRLSPRKAFVVGLLLLTALLTPLPTTGREIQAALDLLHAPAFALLAVLVYVLGRNGLPRLPIRRTACVWTGLSLAGLGVEFLQDRLGRHFSWDDAAANALGAAAGVLWAECAGRWNRSGGPIPTETAVVSADSSNSSNNAYSTVCRFLFPVAPRCALWTTVASLLIVASWQPMWELIDAFRQRREHPRLASFESAAELTRWTFKDCQAARSQRHATHGRWSLRLQFQTGVYPGAALTWPSPNWKGYRELAFDAWLDGDAPLDLTVKVQDRQHNQETHDRFQQVVRLSPGANRIRIALADVAAAPRNRTLDLTQIALLQFYAVRPTRPRILHLDNVHLSASTTQQTPPSGKTSSTGQTPHRDKLPTAQRNRRLGMAKQHSPRFLQVVNDAKSRIRECTVADVKNRLDRGEPFHLIDVREESEWAAGHIPQAVHLGKGVIERDIEQAVPDPDAPIVLYCGGGYRSALAADNLQNMGYRNVISMDGGMRGWRDSGLPETRE